MMHDSKNESYINTFFLMANPFFLRKKGRSKKNTSFVFSSVFLASNQYLYRQFSFLALRTFLFGGCDNFGLIRLNVCASRNLFFSEECENNNHQLLQAM